MVGTTERMNKQREAQLTRREQCIESAPLHTRIIRLSYANAADMAPHVAATLSKRGSVSVDARTNSLIVRDVDCK
jgi:type II secretory pathway component HofQ